MKTKLFTLMMLLLPVAAMAQKKVAILETIDRDGTLNYGVRLMVRSNLMKAVSATAGYEAYDRTDIDAIMGEQNFQRTGYVSEDQIRRLGEMTGAAYILVSEAAKVDANSIFVTAKILDVETARTELTDNALMTMSAADIQKGCESLAAKLLRQQPASDYTSKVATGGYVLQRVNVANQIEKINNNLYVFQGTEMDRKMYEQFLQNNCLYAWEKYRKGTVMTYWGWGLLGGGMVLVPLGVGLCFLPGSEWVSGLAIFPIGAGVASTGVVLLGVGYHQRHNAYKTFNQRCTSEPQISLELRPAANGIGLALTF
ncbi:MAG: hypothetical protein IJ169_00075 [Paludibacteraceae bacterium]|nr:hypothetical protein [Paludibacteraceae bacterium]